MVRCAGFTYGVAEVQTIYSAMENAEPFGFDPPVLILCRLPVPIWTTGFDCRFWLSGGFRDEIITFRVEKMYRECFAV
jgi:hypothetical protein